MNQNGRAAWEWLVFGVVVIVAVFLLGSTYGFQHKLEKEKALHSQLQGLRSAVLLYKAVNKVNPTALEVLANGVFQLPDESLARKYIEHPPTISNGKFLDPFGNVYTYDGKSAWIRSTTKGYESW